MKRILRYISCYFKKTEDIKTMLVYRYISWIITSMFYLIAGHNSSTFIFQMAVIFFVFAAAVIITNMYIMHKDEHRLLKLCIIIETLGITLLLIPTGGLNSPFIWYALNPVLVAASFLTHWFCWGNLLFYILSGTVISLGFNGKEETLKMLLQNNSYMLLALILITIAVQLLSGLTRRISAQASLLQVQGKRLEQINHELNDINAKNKEVIEQMMSLYQVVEASTFLNDRRKLIKIIGDYAARLTMAKFSFFWTCAYKEFHHEVSFNEDHSEYVQQSFIDEIEMHWEIIKKFEVPQELMIDGRKYITAVVRSDSRPYGVIGVESGTELSEKGCEQLGRPLTFLSELCGVILERLELKEVADYLMVTEEQNRIADEIHDSVSQRLFNIVCALYNLGLRLDDIGKEELTEQMKMIRSSASSAIQELRECICRLSTKKRNEEVFLSQVKEYLHEISKMNEISVDVNIKGEEEVLSFAMKNSLYRVICEACGNAIRHGKCKKLGVDLFIGDSLTELTIVDDGRGFEWGDLNTQAKTALGINNMKNLVRSLNGKFHLASDPGKGTSIHVILQNSSKFVITQGGKAV